MRRIYLFCEKTNSWHFSKLWRAGKSSMITNKGYLTKDVQKQKGGCIKPARSVRSRKARLRKLKRIRTLQFYGAMK